MSTRWWAPQTPGVLEHGELDALLRGGGDPEADLGLVLMAGHKAGAAALQNVAKSAIASESALIADLSTARGVVSQRMVDALAPITGEVYAALLVRDVLDEADQGALDLFRTAVSKGVPPPVAVERAAAGYLVPAKEMGAFAALAADPKANPRAVEDAADRSLMTYVAKVAAQEAVSEVSKAAAEHPRENRTLVADTDFDPALHPRGPDGRFVDTPDAPPAPLSALDRIRQRLGLLSTEPTRVAETTKTPTLIPSPQADQIVQARQARARRAQRAQRAAAAQTQTKPAAARAKPQRSQQRSRQRASKARLNRLAERLNERFVERAAPEAEPRIIPDLLQKLPDPGGDYYDLGQPIVIGTSHVAGWGVRQKSADQAMSQKDPSRRIFRIGHLVNEAKYVEQQGVAQVTAHELHAEAELTGTPVEYAHPIVRTIKHHELTNPTEDFRHADRLMDQMVTRDVEMPNGDVRPVVDYDERNHVQALPVYEPLHVPVYDDNAVEQHDHEEAIALVHWQPADPNKPDVRPIPYVEEYVILTDARGYEEGTGRSVDIHLDPNQVYEVVPSPNARPGSLAGPEAMYDLDNQVVVNRWYLRPVDHEDVDDIIEGFDKALSPAELATFNQLHPRDAEGQFTETADETVTETTPSAAEVSAARQARVRRAQRAQRASMRTVVAPTPLKPQRAKPQRQLQRAKPKRSRQHPLAEAIHERVLRRRTPDMPMLTDAREYKVVSEREFQSLARSFTDEEFSALHKFVGSQIRLTRTAQEGIITRRDVSVDNIPTVMGINVAEQVARQAQPRDVLEEIRYHSRAGVPDYEHVAERIEHLLEIHPEYDLIDIERDSREGVVVVYGSRASGSFQNIIEYDPDLDLTGPLWITYLGESRARDVLTKKDDVISSLVGDLTKIGDYEDDALVPNPTVHRYRLVSAPVRRYRVDND